MNEKVLQHIQFCIELDKMKSVYRQTILVDGSREETDAEHSWHFAMMAMTLFEYNVIPGVDLNRVLRMALVHDLVEIYAGDTFAFDEEGNKDKYEREQAAAERLFSMLPQAQGTEYRALWEEFDAEETPDAKYAAAIDVYQPFLNNSVTKGHTWVKHGVFLPQVLKRLEPVRIATPALYEYAMTVLDDAVAKRYIKTK